MVRAVRQEPVEDEPTREELDARLMELVHDGFARWGGGKPGGSKKPLKMPAGVRISDYIIEERDALRGSR